MLIGLISDTHDLLRPEALAALQGVDQIIHAGDICEPGILEELRRLAPVGAVRGNCDHGPWAEALPETLYLEFGGVSVYVIHRRKNMDLDPVAAGIDVVVSGHTHEPGVENEGPVLFVNPGAAGNRRFTLPTTVGLLRIEDRKPTVQIRSLLDQP